MTRRYVTARTRQGWAVFDLRIRLVTSEPFERRADAKARAREMEARRTDRTETRKDRDRT